MEDRGRPNVEGRKSVHTKGYRTEGRNNLVTSQYTLIIRNYWWPGVTRDVGSM